MSIAPERGRPTSPPPIVVWKEEGRKGRREEDKNECDHLKHISDTISQKLRSTPYSLPLPPSLPTQEIHAPRVDAIGVDQQPAQHVVRRLCCVGIKRRKRRMVSIKPSRFLPLLYPSTQRPVAPSPFSLPPSLPTWCPKPSNPSKSFIIISSSISEVNPPSLPPSRPPSDPPPSPSPSPPPLPPPPPPPPPDDAPAPEAAVLLPWLFPLSSWGGGGDGTGEAMTVCLCVRGKEGGREGGRGVR